MDRRVNGWREGTGRGMPDDVHVKTRLRALEAVGAPAGLLPAVLAEVGLADAYATVESPLGPVFCAYNRDGVSAVRLFTEAAGFEDWFRARFGRTVRCVPALPEPLARSVMGQLRGSRRSGVRFDLRGRSEFERAVLRKALEIPRGEVRPYAWVAREIGRRQAVRAVGNVLAGNPIPLLIPCHRVVRSDGRIGGYALGPTAKRALLNAEGAEPDRLERLMGSGARLLGSKTTLIYCFPGCRNARRIEERNQARFGSERQAQAAGYRPCRVCRPASAC